MAKPTGDKPGADTAYRIQNAAQHNKMNIAAEKHANTIRGISEPMLAGKTAKQTTARPVKMTVPPMVANRDLSPF